MSALPLRGQVEHKLRSRDIEDMSGLVVHMPRVAVMILVGIAGMFLAPFGMLVSKWAVLRALVDTYPLLCLVRRLRRLGHALFLGEVDGQVD